MSMEHQESTLIEVLFGNALTHSDSLHFNVINDCFGSNTETKIRFLDIIVECSLLTVLSLVTLYMYLYVFLEQFRSDGTLHLAQLQPSISEYYENPTSRIKRQQNLVGIRLKAVKPRTVSHNLGAKKRFCSFVDDVEPV